MVLPVLLAVFTPQTALEVGGVALALHLCWRVLTVLARRYRRQEDQRTLELQGQNKALAQQLEEHRARLALEVASARSETAAAFGARATQLVAQVADLNAQLLAAQTALTRVHEARVREAMRVVQGAAAQADLAEAMERAVDGLDRTLAVVTAMHQMQVLQAAPPYRDDTCPPPPHVTPSPAPPVGDGSAPPRALLETSTHDPRPTPR